jgi:hypothetical protein
VTPPRQALPPQSALVLQFLIRLQLHRQYPWKVARKTGAGWSAPWASGLQTDADASVAKRSAIEPHPAAWGVAA